MNYMQTLHVNPENIKGTEIEITGDDHGHLIRALRKKPGDRLTVSCEGTGFCCEVGKVGDDSAILKIICDHAVSGEPGIKICLYQAIPKGDKMDMIIQKAVELGVGAIYPIETKRVVVKLDQGKRKAKAERWSRIAKESAQQCGRSVVPEIHDIIGFDDAVNIAAGSSFCIFPYELEHERHIKDLDIEDETVFSVFIGPEGGFDDAEVKTVVSRGITPVSLGTRILRTETATLAVLSILMHIKGEI